MMRLNPGPSQVPAVTLHATPLPRPSHGASTSYQPTVSRGTIAPRCWILRKCCENGDQKRDRFRAFCVRSAGSAVRRKCGKRLRAQQFRTIPLREENLF